MTETSESGEFVPDRQFIRPSFYTAALAFLIGLMVIIGWTFDIEFLKRPLESMAAMNPISAVAFVMTGIALMILAPAPSKQPFPRGTTVTLYILSGIPVILVFLKAAGFPVDTLLLFSDVKHERDLRPFLLPPATIVNMMLLCAAIILTATGYVRAKRIANILIGAGFVGALFAIIGYSYHVAEFADFSLMPMAVHSAVAFLLAGMSLLLTNQGVGFMREVTSPNSGGTISRTLIPVALLVATLIGYSRLFVTSRNPISMELGFSLLLTIAVSLFVLVVLFVAKKLNTEDGKRRGAEAQLARINSDLKREVVERKSELDQNEKRYQALFDQSVDAISLSDINNNLIYQSPAAERITGYSLQERQNIPGTALVHPDDIHDVSLGLSSINGTPGASVKYQWRVRHKAGHYFWMEGVVTNLIDDPNIRAIVNNYRDITERKQHEETIAGSERRFRALIEHSVDALVLTDENLNVLYQSPSVERMIGISMEHRRANPNLRNIHQEDLPQMLKIIEKSKEAPGRGLSFQARVNHMFGHTIWIEGVITNLFQDESVGAMVFNYRDVSERRKLEEQQALFASLVNSSNDAILSKNLDGIITSWNRGAQLLFGYTPAEAVGQSILILVPPDLRKEETSILQRIRNGVFVETFETRRIKKDGSIAFITITASPIRNADGDVIGASNISHDISERLDSERKLKGERTMLRTLIDNIPDYIYVKDVSSRHVINNKAMVGLVGAASEEETLGKSSMDFFGEGVAASYIEEDKHIFRSGLPMINFEESTVTKSGEHKYLLTTKVPLTDEQNNVIGIVGISRDVTQQKQTELDLRTSKYLLESAQQVASIGHWTLQAGPPATSKLSLSSETYRIFGIDPQSFDGKLQTFLGFVHPADLHEVNRAFSSALVNQVSYSMDHRVLTNNGIDKWVHVQTEVTFDSDKGLPLLLGIVQDITERKKIESEILLLNASLEKKVGERTSQLEAVNKELEAFSYSISHDLRAPLRIIDGFATILMEDADGHDERIAKHARTISRNATRMGQLVDDLLNFSRLGRTQIKVTVVDMRGLVDQVLEEFQAADLIKTANININDLHPAKGDGSLIKQVWVNLLSNAIKYSSKKEKPVVELGMVPKADPPTWFVKDNGAGFSMDYASKLFGVFQRLHKQDEFDGTGVGLALVQRIVLRHGGRVWAESKLNEGATFFFTLSGHSENHSEV
ncbi:MAG TPA: PAS domain S-box protein [Cyclobacteriaceae bacterium]|nr:PAS domain S-box protein [Cyclobacteriaceae bacterium]